MRRAPYLCLDIFRRVHPTLGDSALGADYGYFEVPAERGTLRVISSGAGSKWEHVSVSLADRCPTWDEMQRVKELFWDDDETVLQFHPASAAYVNTHPHCLHLWKVCGENHELPQRGLI